MTYQVYISTTTDEAGRSYAQAVRQALWRIQELPLVPLAAAELPAVSPQHENPAETVRRIIDQADILIGVYGGSYGPIPPGHDYALEELEYRYAHERGILCLIFFPKDAEKTSDERLLAFKQYLMEHHVIHHFSSLDDLQARVVLEMSKAKRTLPRPGRLRLPPIQSLRSFIPSPAAAEDAEAAAAEMEEAQTLETTVRQALAIAEDDLEALVRRALEVHQAQQMAMQPDTPDPAEGQLVRPIFGPPSMQSQFRSDVFMIMPFRAEYDSVYRNIIQPVTAELNLTIKRGDDFSSIAGSIIQEVWAAINACRLVIVETTEVNANVYYELGIAHTLGKPAVLLTQKDSVEDRPFDIRHLRFIRYDNTIAGGDKLREDLRRSIIWILNDLEEAGRSNK